MRRIHGGSGIPKGPGWPPSIAIVDTGIEAFNSELAVTDGFNCATDDHADWGDVDGHGTTLAGVVGAKHNGSGIIGVAPGAELYAVRVFADETLASEDNVICGLRWIHDNADDIDVALIAFNRPDEHRTDVATCQADRLRQLMCQLLDAGVTVISAAGNQKADASGFIPAKLHQVITVGAIADFDGVPGGLGSPTCGPGEDDSVADFSNTGPSVDIYAPGVCIQTTKLNSIESTIDPSGTSLAAAHVAGAAAIYMACHVEATPTEVRAALLDSAETISQGDMTVPIVAVMRECTLPQGE
ncbi:S8 family serine peptidase [Candidatus Poriferisodalis sp.]|uniref:S8 family serine peptidase n=1 Tax=Candidatus Poriferisodalis sp. TaxID=3101277 RepID=UPI003B01BFB6